MTIFGVPWQQLSLTHVQSFFRDAGPEALLWESKGTRLNAGEIRDQVCGFANSHEGGFLVLGASEHGERWNLDGVAFPTDPPVWISSIVGDGAVTPYPDGVDIKAWPVEDEKHVAVVWIPPSPVPPCNSRGRVFERVSGRTIPVTDPVRLAALFERGDAARVSAARRAQRMAEYALNRKLGEDVPQTMTQFGLGLAAPGYGPDLAPRLFRRDFEQSVISSISTVLTHDQVSPHLMPRVIGDVAQDHRTFQTLPGDQMSISWATTIASDGGIGIYWTQGGRQLNIDMMCQGPLRQAWTCLEEILAAFKPQGARYVHLAVVGPMFLPERVLSVPPTTVARGPVSPTAEGGVLESIGRELRRASGEMVYEPPAG